MNVVSEVWVSGCPKTKGSLDMYHNNGRTFVSEGVRGSKEWRSLMRRAIERERRQRRAEPIEPRDAVGVRALFVMPPGPGDFERISLIGPGVLPTVARVGDLDKLCRNLLDAMQDAGAVKDDTQVCRLIASKIYAASDAPVMHSRLGRLDGPGVLVQAWVMDDLQAQSARVVMSLL